MLLAACLAPTPEVREIEVTREVIVEKEVEVEVEVTREVQIDVRPAGGVPYEALWQASAHGSVDSEAFRHWDDSAQHLDCFVAIFAAGPPPFLPFAFLSRACCVFSLLLWSLPYQKS